MRSLDTEIYSTMLGEGMKNLPSLILFVISIVFSNNAESQARPKTAIIENSIKEADYLIVATIRSASMDGNGRMRYILSEKIFVKGSSKKECMVSRLPYEVGVKQFFFVNDASGGCLNGGDRLPRSLPIRKIENEEYIVFSSEKYAYPDLKNEIITIESSLWESGKVIPLWTGVRLKAWLEYVRDGR